MARVFLDVVHSMNMSYDLTLEEIELMKSMSIKEHEHFRKYIEKRDKVKQMKTHEYGEKQ